MSANYVANVMYPEIVKKTSMPPFGVMHTIHTRFGYEISYDMTWRAEQKVLEKMFGTYKDSYNNLPYLLEVIQGRNPGTCIAIHDIINHDGGQVLQRVF